MEGRDLAPLLAGKDLPARSLYWHQPHFWGLEGPGIQPFSAVRRGRHKLVYFHGPRRCELYDLESDVGEMRDLARERPVLLRTLAEDLSAWAERVGARMSIDRGTNEEVPLPREVVGS